LAFSLEMKRKPRQSARFDLTSDVLPLFEAVRTGSLKDVTRLLNGGASLHITDSNGWTPLHIAAVWNQAHLIEPLFIAGADLEAKTPTDGEFNLFRSCTALHCTIEGDALEAAIELIRCGANIDARDVDGATPLRLAVETSGTYQLLSARMAKLFIEAGADINAYDSGGYTIFHEASNAIDLAPGHRESQDVIAMLQERKAWMW
jgi:hypothetical protein